MQILKKTINIIIDILIILMLIISAAVAGIAIASKSDGIPNLFGYAPLSVQSDSMVPTFESGDLIISKVVDENTELNVGDVITYVMNIDGQDVLNSHKIVDITTSNGFTFYTTKGDNNPTEDEEPVIETNVLAKYTGTCLKGFGTVYDFLTSQLGFFLVILLPLIIFFLYEVFRVIRNLIEYNKEKALEQAVKASAAVSNSGLSEEEMKIAVEKYLAEQSKQENDSVADNNDTENKSNINDTEE